MGFTPNDKYYRPPFITQTDEAVWNDCTVCSTLMATAAATYGLTTMNRRWRPLGRKGLKRRREAIRNKIPGDQDIGGTSMADMRVAFKAFFPWLPDLYETFYDVQKNTWSEMLDKLADGWVAVLQGNPMSVKDPSSPLRKWTNNDNFGHAIYADRARKTSSGNWQIFIMDPLGRGTYRGQWVNAEHVRQFIWKEQGYVKANMFKRGAWSIEAGIKADYETRINDYLQQIKNLRSRLRSSRDEVADLEKQLSELPTPVDCSDISAQLADKTREAAQLQVDYNELAEEYARIVVHRQEIGVALDDLNEVYDEGLTTPVE